MTDQVADLADKPVFSLSCGVCLYDESGDEADDAITVIEGYAVCENHLGFVAQGSRFHAILETARREHRGERG